MPALAWVIGILISAARLSFAGELKTVSRNALVFIDSVNEHGEWAAYRLVDERNPVIFRAEGPGRVLLKLRTFVPAEKEAVGAILKDQEIILTARVEPARDPDEKLVDRADKRAPSKARLYVVRLGPGEHTVTVRYSEGAPILVSAKIASGGEPEAGVPLVAPEGGGEEGGIQRVGRLRMQKDESGAEGARTADIEEIADEQGFESAESGAEGEESPGAEHGAPSRSVEDGASRTADRISAQRPENADAWTPAPHRFGERDAPRIGPGEADPFGPIDRRPSSGAALRRRLTVPAPYLMLEARGGVLFSRFGLDPAPQIGLDGRIPLPGLDSRRFTLGFSADASYARGASRVVDDTGRAAVDFARIHYAALELGADVRWVFMRIEEVLDPYVALGGALILGRLETEDAAGSASGGTSAIVGNGRFGAAFGPLGRRPFFELEVAVGEISSPLTRRDRSNVGDDRAAYTAVSALVGYRFELLTDVPTE